MIIWLFYFKLKVAKHSLIVASYSASQLKTFTLSSFIIWLVPWAGKMTQIACCDWLPGRARWSRLGLPTVSHKENFLDFKRYNKSFIDQVCSVKMAGYWPHSFFASLWTSSSSQSINMLTADSTVSAFSGASVQCWCKEGGELIWSPQMIPHLWYHLSRARVLKLEKTSEHAIYTICRYEEEEGRARLFHFCCFNCA